MSNRHIFESIFKFCLYALLLSVVFAGCAAPSPRLKNQSDKLFINLSGSEAATHFPDEFQDIYLTMNRGDALFSLNKIEQADMYYLLAIGKIELLEKQHVDELKRREIARLERENREMIEKSAAEELLRKQAQERELAEKATRIAAMEKKIEAEKLEARKKAERVRPEKEIPHAAVHTVKRGETLPQIAALAEVYGDTSLWPLLYKANRDQISNPAVLWPGQVLRIPRNYDRNDLNEARKFSSDRQIR